MFPRSLNQSQLCFSISDLLLLWINPSTTTPTTGLFLSQKGPWRSDCYQFHDTKYNKVITMWYRWKFNVIILEILHVININIIDHRSTVSAQKLKNEWRLDQHFHRNQYVSMWSGGKISAFSNIRIVIYPSLWVQSIPN